MLKVDTACMEEQVRQMNEIARQLNNISSCVDDVNRQLRWNVSVSTTVRSRLSNYASAISVLDNKAVKMANVLSNAVVQYRQTENDIKENKKAQGTKGTQGTSDKSGGFSASGDWLGYQRDEEDGIGVEAYVGKGTASYQKGDISAEVNGYIGKAKADFDTEFSLFEVETERKKEDGKWVEEEVITLINAEAGTEASVSVLSGDATLEAGDDMLGSEVEAEGDVLTAGVEGKGKFSIGEKGVNAYVEGGAMAAAAKGKVKGTVNILGLEFSVTAGGYAGAIGVEGKYGFEDGKFVAEGGAAAGVGGSFGIEIGVNKTGWNNFVDFVTFWD